MWLKFHLWCAKRSAGKSAVAELHTVLQTVKRHAEEGDDSGVFNKGTGICGNVFMHKMGRNAHRLFHDLMQTWPNRYEEGDYIVGGSVEFEVTKIERTLWDSPRRHELLNWLIEVTK